MKSALSFFALLIAATAVSTRSAKPECGCGKDLPKGVELDKSVNLTLKSESGVSPRKYRIHIPPSYDNKTPVPLILSFHGRGKDAKYQEALSQFSNASYGFQGIVAYPEGVPVFLHPSPRPANSR
jgi:poly(3-hydroxybutyrate) depolymerase